MSKSEVLKKNISTSMLAGERAERGGDSSLIRTQK